MVKTRAQAKIEEKRNDKYMKPVMSRSAADLITSAESNNSLRSVQSSTKIRAQKLALQAEYVRKVGEAEATAAAAAAAAAAAKATVTAERKAAELELESQLAMLEVESGRSRRSSRASIQRWLDTVDNDVVVEPDTIGPSTSNKRLDDIGFRQNISGGRSSREPFQSAATANMPINFTTSIQHDTNELKTKQQTDTFLLAQAITSLVNNSTKHKCGDSRLPIFDGKPLDWLTFKRTFEDSKTTFSATENLTRIGMSLRGAAREEVSVLLVSARDPAVVMDALEMRFGRSELIVLNEIIAVRSLPKINSDNYDLNKFVCRIRNCVETIRLLNQRCYLESPELFQAILIKLTPLLRNKWTEYGMTHSSPEGQTKLELLAQFLSREIELQLKFGLIPDPVVPPKRFEKVHAVSFSEFPYNTATVKPSKTHVNPTYNEIIKPCLICKQSHNLSKCNKFIEMSIHDRWQFVKENKLCHKCLKKGSHSYKYCKFTKEICEVVECKPRHHKLLHNVELLATHTIVKNEPDSDVYTGSQDRVDVSNEQPNEVLTHTTYLTENNAVSDLFDKRDYSRPLLKIIKVTIMGPLGSVNTNALLDDGSTATLIDSKICQQIGITGPESDIMLDCVSGLGKKVKAQHVDFKIKGYYSPDVFAIRNARSIDNLGLSKQKRHIDDITQFRHLKDLSDLLCYERGEPKLIIGLDNWHLLISKETRIGTKSQPVAIKTNLGWVLFGFNSSKTKPVNFVNHVHLTDSEDSKNLSMLIQNYYKLDSLGIIKKDCLNDSDARALKILEETTRRLPDGKFEVGLLWRDDTFVVPDSFGHALSRFRSLERKMSREPAFAKQYKLNMQALFEKEYAEGPISMESYVKRCWYLPHFGVTNPNKPGKLRIVYDAAAKSNGVSLNSMLLTGPDLLNPILDILFRFREFKVGLSADIREMFPQVKIREDDRDAQRFLWRNCPNEPIQVFRMASMIFGAASSPFTAQFIKNKNALDYQTQFPEAVDAILNDHYMDDCIVSIPSVADAARLASDIVSIHKNAGYEMRSWVSNEPEALALIPKEFIVESSLADVDLGRVAKPVRTLGLVWQPTEDFLSFNAEGFKKKAIVSNFTKRDALSLMMCVYDPLGLLAPLIVIAKILFQNVWRKAVDWNHQLTEEDTAAWKEWHDVCIRSFNNFKIPRRYNLSEFDDVVVERELHLFCDASESAYSAVAYWRLILPDKSIRIVLIGSKTRVAPLKPVSVSRLELQGALVAARLADTICNAHKLKPYKRVFWCDSMNVLGWLRNDARNFKPFVANRLGEILELSNVSEWRWVPTKLNVADDATRLKREPLNIESRWFAGPEFLYSGQWPNEPSADIRADQFELKPKNRITCHTIVDDPFHPLAPVSASPHRISKWLCLIRATALAHLFASKLLTILRGRVENTGLTPLHLTASNLQMAEIHVLWQSQLDCFKTEICCLRNNTPLPRNSKLLKLSPTITDDNLLRLFGRINAAPHIKTSTKFPVILDGRHPAVRLLVLRYHHRAAHANTETVVNELRQLYWILNLRSTVRSVAHNCLFCKHQKNKPFDPPMGKLPEERLAHHQRPFSFVGVDYFGPLQVTVGRGHQKRYVALYTCLVTRAVHLEVVYSLTTDAAMMSLRRFIARRGLPRQVFSDNGTAFIGLSRELKKLYEQQISNFAANELIQWKFIPPAAPFMGGAWERLVRSIKTALKVTLKDKSPTDEVLSTLLLEAEAVVNCRPLTHVSPDPDYPEALTPFHFLIGTSSINHVPFVVEDSDLHGRIRWKKAARMADHFWRRWVVEYLPLLNPSTGIGQRPDIKVGDVVLVADNNLPRGMWPKGRVLSLYKGKDGVPRVADVATAGGHLKRPLKKLIFICNTAI